MKVKFIILISFVFLHSFKALSQDTTELFFVEVEPFSHENWRTPLTDSVIDISKNVYHTQQLGEQVWMIENLSAVKFNDGTKIEVVEDSATWVNCAKPAVYYLEEFNRYYYNYYVVESEKNVCPTGWKLPDSLDIQLLERHVNQANNDFGKTTWGPKNDTVYIYSDGTHWTDLPMNGLSFSDQPYGYVNGIRGKHQDGIHGYWWVTNSKNIMVAYQDEMRKGLGVDGIHLDEIKMLNFNSSGFQVTHGLNIRCLQE